MLLKDNRLSNSSGITLLFVVAGLILCAVSTRLKFSICPKVYFFFFFFAFFLSFLVPFFLLFFLAIGYSLQAI